MASECKRRLLCALLLATVLSGPGCAAGLATLQTAKSESAALLDRYRESREQERSAAQAEAEQAEEAKAEPTLEELVTQGDRYRDSGELAGALLSYLQAHRSDRDRPEPRERIAYLHLRHDPGRSEAIFEGLLEANPYEARFHTGLALAQLALERPEEARDALAEAITLEPSAATPRALIGVIHDQLGDHESARTQYEAAHELRPKDWQILNNLGVSLLMAQQPEEAVDRLRAAVNLAPRDPAVRNNLGLALGLAGRHDDAFREFARVSDEPHAHNNLGWVLYLKGDYALALEHFESALAVGPDELLTVVRNMELAEHALRTNKPAPLEWAFRSEGDQS